MTLFQPKPFEVGVACARAPPTLWPRLCYWAMSLVQQKGAEYKPRERASAARAAWAVRSARKQDPTRPGTFITTYLL